MSDLFTTWHPGLPIFVAMIVCLFADAKTRNIAAVTGPLLSFFWVLFLPAGSGGASIGVLGLDFQIWQMDLLSKVFAIAFTGFGAMAATYAWTEQGRAKKFFNLMNVAGGLGVCLVGDLFSLFIFWEMLTVSSMFMVFMGREKDSTGAAIRYAYFHLAGGVCLLGGAILAGGTFEGVWAQGEDGLAFWLILVGVLVNAAGFPLHAWLPDAYPRASIYGTVFLAAFTTKSAVYVAARLMPGAEPLVWVGAIMAVFGVSMAVLENNMRRLLCYHIVSQVGYMICGVGLGNLALGKDAPKELIKSGEMAVNGAAAHAFCHIFYKGLLLMSVGAVIYATGRQHLSKLGGLSKALVWTMILCAIGGFSISALPGTNGFVSKSMIVSAAYYATESPWDSRAWVEFLLTIASMGTFFSVGLKLPYLAFIAKPKEGVQPEVKQGVPRSMYIGMIACAVVCIGLGLFPGLLYMFMPYKDASPYVYHPFTAGHFVGSGQMLVGTLLAFVLVRGLVRTKPTFTLDVDALYRGPLDRAIAGVGSGLREMGVVWEDCFHGARIMIWRSWLRGKQILLAQPIAHHVAVVIAALTLAAMVAVLIYR